MRNLRVRKDEEVLLWTMVLKMTVTLMTCVTLKQLPRKVPDQSDMQLQRVHRQEGAEVQRGQWEGAAWGPKQLPQPEAMSASTPEIG